MFTNCYIVCRPTSKEANEYHHYYAVEMADEGAVDALVARRARRGRYDDLPEEMKRNLRQRAGGGNGAYPIVGNPDTGSEAFNAAWSGDRRIRDGVRELC